VRHAPRRPALRENRRFACSAFVGGLFALLACSVSAQNPLPTPGIPTEAEAERVIITGSNIPTAEETGPNPVDTYRTQDIEKLGVRNATDLLIRLPQEAGGTVNQNIANGGDGSVIPNLRGLLPKETLVLVDGKRVAPNANGAGVDINLIPFPMIDRIEILKDGASAIKEPTRLRVCSTSSCYTNSAASRSEARGETPTWELPMMRAKQRHG
jgi:outer membrane receptor for ferrienterochelin and colicin